MPEKGEAQVCVDIKKINTENIVDAVKILKNIYDVVRIVDPVQNTILHIKDRKSPAVLREGACYAIWKKNKFCDNCISYRAIKEKDTFVKFEVIDERVYMITASPVEYQDGCYVVEMLTDITGKGVLESMAGESTEDFTNLVLRLNDALVRDELTKIFNRRYINERLPIEIFHSIANANPAALVIIDIDKFKNKNDMYGHIAGDAILEQFAYLLMNGVQEERDWVARYGGEEFLLYLHNRNLEQAVTVAEQIRKAIEYTQFTIPSGFVNITCSLGICILEKEMTMTEWIDCADKKLYEAKATGGNRIVV